MKQFYVYMLSNISKTLYVGVTSALVKRIYEHKEGFVDGFTKKYNVKMLVYFEKVENAETAIKREKQLKSWRRDKKEMLINKMNPDWKDLYLDIC